MIELGCGPGPNLVRIFKNFPGRQLGGVDVNPEAIELAKKTFKGGLFKVGSIEDVMMSDKSTDVVLTDMCLIYFSPSKVGKVLEEIKRVARRHIVLCELHTTSFWRRMKIRLFEGYYMHNYKKLLESHGFYDINLIKVKKEHWPESTLQQNYSYIITALVPKRK